MTTATKTKKKNIQIIKDPKGKPQGVYMDYQDYEQLIEDYMDMSIMVSRLDEPRMTLDELKKRLKRDGLL